MISYQSRLPSHGVSTDTVDRDARSTASGSALASSTLYKPLDNHSFRLVRSLSDTPQPPNYEMQVFDTTDKTLVYKALSYCWGPEEPLLDVLVNGRRFRVRTNLYRFLSYTAVMNDNRYDWWFIDAVCINQQDLSERSGQVSLMSDIYRNAAQVCIWLTDLDYDESCDDFEHGEFLDEDYRVIQKAESTGVWPDGTRATGDDVRALDVTLAGVAGALISQSRYWLRLWIVQEVIMAKELMIQWRHYMWSGKVLDDITLKHLPDVAGQQNSLNTHDGIAISPALWMARQRSDDLLMHYMCATIMQTKMLWGDFLRSGGFLPFYKLLSSFGGQSCSVMHDRVFGLLAMTKTSITPDYSMTSMQLLAVMAIEFLVSMGHGNMLPLCNEIDEEPPNPKYVANLQGIIQDVLHFPLDDPVVMLVIQEVVAYHGLSAKTCAAWLDMSAICRPFISKWYRKTKIYRKVDSWGVRHRKEKALAILTAAERNDSLLVAPGDEKETKSYSDWKHTVREICAELDRRRITTSTHSNIELPNYPTPDTSH